MTVHNADLDGATVTPLRNYQRKALRVVLDNDAVVLLPTGSGKTLIAAAAIKLTLTRDTVRPRALFLVPTVVLARQQAEALRRETLLRVKEFVGGTAAPAGFDILVCTPAAFLNLIDVAPEFVLMNYAHVTFDEVHHVRGKHPYNDLAHMLRMLEGGPRLLGLSASLTYATSELDIRKSIQVLCATLGVKGDCIVTADTDELRRDGYHASEAKVVTSFAKTYISLVEDDKPLVLPVQPHAQLSEFLALWRSGDGRLHSLTLALLNAIVDVEKMAAKADPSFTSPMAWKDKIVDWGDYAHEKALDPRGSASSQAVFVLLEHLYEALRIIVNSQQGSLELAMMYLRMVNVIGEDATFEAASLTALDNMWNAKRGDFKRFDHLKQVLFEQFDVFGDALHVIIFAQARITTHILDHAIKNDPELALFLRAGIAYSTARKATPSFSVSKTSNSECLQMFRTGHINLMIATSVAEEGMDIAAANCVIRFDAVQHTVSLVQSRGRAREAESSFVVMQDNHSVTMDHLVQAERLQGDVIKTLIDTNIVTTESLVRERKEMVRRLQSLGAHASHGGTKVLLKHLVRPIQPARYVLKQYCERVNGRLQESYAQSLGGWSCVLAVVNAEGVSECTSEALGANKKEALAQGCEALLESLIGQAAMM